MKLNQKGFSLIEIMAVLLISSIILVPLMTAYTTNLEINNRSQMRRNATSIADGSLYGLEKIDFSDFRGKLDTANSSTNYIVLNSTNCSLLDDSVDIALCDNIFGTIWNNTSFGPTEYQMFMFDYSLTTSQYNSLMSSAMPQEVKDAIAEDVNIQSNIDGTDVDSLIRVVVWIDYYDLPDLYVTLTGLIFDE